MAITLSQVVTWVTQAIQLALILIFAVTVAQLFGVRIPMVPTMAPISLLYICGAWALLQGKVKLG